MPKAKTPELEKERLRKLSESIKRSYTEGRRVPYCGGNGGYKPTPEMVARLRTFRIGKPPPNRGTQLTPKARDKVSQGTKEWWRTIRGTEKETNCIKQIQDGSASSNPVSKDKQRKSLKKWWSNPDNKAKIEARNEAVRKGVKRAWSQGKYNSEEWCKNQSESQKQGWGNDPTRAKRCLGFRKPNKLEIAIDGMLQTYFPGEWKYVGNGEVKIGRKNPDWININGFKGVIEAFGMHWHHEKRTESETIEYYTQYGLKCLIIQDDGHGVLSESEIDIVNKIKQWKDAV